MDRIDTPRVTARKPRPAPSDGRNQRRKARTRAALLAAARRLFGEAGVDATTVAEIAEEADIAIGSFYNYFHTKEDLLAELLRETLAEQLALMELRRAGITDLAEAISVAHRHFVRLTSEQPEWAWLLVRLDVPHRVIDTVLAAPAMRDLQAGIAQGRFQVADPGLALAASGGALIAVMHSLLLGELGEHADSAHAEGVLRSFGLDAGEAAEIARRVLPDAATAGPGGEGPAT